MPPHHTLPVPPSLISHACEVIARNVTAIPFVRDGIEVTQDLIAGTLEELNAEATRTLALSFMAADNGTVLIDGLDRHLLARGFCSSGSAVCIAQVLTEAGITAKASVADRRSHRFLRAVRLLPLWTWTIPTGNRELIPSWEMPFMNDETAGWTSLCPVCRAGRLVPVTGQQLYGIKETDFFTCTSCGAKYIPESGKYRLVAIARRKDPLWSDLLNKAFTADDWQAIAQKGNIPELYQRTHPAKTPGKNTTLSGQVYRIHASFPLEIGNRTLFFTRIPLRFSKGYHTDLFRGRRDTVQAILRMPSFRHLEEVTLARYRHYLDVPAGLFLAELKNRKDPFYLQFLHPYGDRLFCSFRAGDAPRMSRRGIYILVVGEAVQVAGATVRPFRETIDNLLGTIDPAACYLDGDPRRCRINSILCSERQHGHLCIHPLEDEGEIGRLSTELTTRFSPSGI